MLNARETLRDGMGGIYEFGESGMDITRFDLRSVCVQSTVG
jgi:hypothetical protein